MRILVLLLTVFSFSAIAKTSVKLTAEGRYQFHAKKMPGPTIGLGLYQTLGKRFAFNSWTGVGHEARLQSPTVRWLATKQEIIFHANSTLDLSVQYIYKNALQPDLLVATLGEEGSLVDEHAVGVKVALKLF